VRELCYFKFDSVDFLAIKCFKNVKAKMSQVIGNDDDEPLTICINYADLNNSMLHMCGHVSSSCFAVIKNYN